MNSPRFVPKKMVVTGFVPKKMVVTGFVPKKMVVTGAMRHRRESVRRVSGEALWLPPPGKGRPRRPRPAGRSPGVSPAAVPPSPPRGHGRGRARPGPTPARGIGGTGAGWTGSRRGRVPPSAQASRRRPAHEVRGRRLGEPGPPVARPLTPRGVEGAFAARGVCEGRGGGSCGGPRLESPPRPWPRGAATAPHAAGEFPPRERRLSCCVALRLARLPPCSVIGRGRAGGPADGESPLR